MKPQSPQQDPNLHPYDDDEISLWEIFDTLRARWKIIAAFGIVAPVLAFVATLFIPNQYEARVLLEVGSVGAISETTSNSSGSHISRKVNGSVPIETNRQLLQRIEEGAFVESSSRHLGFPFSLTGTEPKGGGLLSLTFRAASPEQVKLAADYSIAKIMDRHAKEAEPAIRILEESLANIESQLRVNQAMLQKFEMGLKNNSVTDPMSFLALSQITSRIGALEGRRDVLRQALSTSATSQTRALDVVLTRNAVYPNTQLVTVLALLGGIFLGVLVALLAGAWSNRKPAVPPAG